jgi:hypothetical protein
MKFIRFRVDKCGYQQTTALTQIALLIYKEAIGREYKSYLFTNHSSALCEALRRKYGESRSKNLRMSLFKDLLVFLSSTDLSKDRDDISNKFL